MARWGSIDVTQLRAFARALGKLSGPEMDRLCINCSKALAARLLALVIPKTPVGKYPPGSGKKGGTLRRGWGANSAGAAAGYANSLSVMRAGNIYTVEIRNPVEYASYVEFGHRTVNGGWSEGRYMLTISEERLKTIAPAVLESMVLKKLREACDV